MSKSLAAGLSALMLTGLLTALHHTHPGGAPGFAVALWSAPDAERRLERERQRGEELDARFHVVAARMALKQRIAEDVLAGRTALAQAGSQFSDLAAADPSTLEQLRCTYPGGSDHERGCRQVIGWVETMLSGSPEQQAQTLARLEAEYARELCEPE